MWYTDNVNANKKEVHTLLFVQPASVTQIKQKVMIPYAESPQPVPDKTANRLSGGHWNSIAIPEIEFVARGALQHRFQNRSYLRWFNDLREIEMWKF